MQKVFNRFFYRADEYAPCALQSATGCENFVFELIDGSTAYAVAGLSTTCATVNIVIPSVYNGLPVRKIKNGAFAGCEKLVSAVIPNSVTDVGAGHLKAVKI